MELNGSHDMVTKEVCMKLVAHCIVKNEERFVWYAIESVLPHVDKVVVWDTGSTDDTVKIIRSIKNEKVVFKEVTLTAKETMAYYRNKMLEEHTGDWIMILDGDEIWEDRGMREAKNLMENPHTDVIISPVVVAVGDLYHIQDQRAGKYRIAGRVGHYNLRFLRYKPSIQVVGTYPLEGYTNSTTLLQDYSAPTLVFQTVPYLHASHLVRSKAKSDKVKYELGHALPFDYYYPESFFYPRPQSVPFVWEKRDPQYTKRAVWQTPLKAVKRRIRR